MNTNKKGNAKVSASLAVALLVGVVAVVSAVRAWSGQTPPAAVIENASVVNVNQAAVPVVHEASLAEPPVLGAQARDTRNQKEECWGKDCIFHLNGAYATNTDTLFSIPDPFLKATSTNNDVVIAGPDGSATTSAGNDLIMGFTGDTSTVELVRLKTRATGTVDSNLNYICGSAANAFGVTSTRSQILIDTPQAATGTAYSIESGMVSTTWGGQGNLPNVQATNGFYDAVSTTLTSVMTAPVISRIYLTPAAPYLFCRIKNPDKTNANGGLSGTTSTASTFAGSWVIRISGQH